MAPPSLVERLSAGMTALFGAVLLAPAGTYGSTPSYAALARVIPEAVLGGVMLLLGLGAMLAIRTRRVRPRRRYLFVQAGLWAWLALAFGIANWPAGGWVVFSAWALAAGGEWWQLRKAQIANDPQHRARLWPDLGRHRGHVRGAPRG